ncbi:lysine--tRNA ligase [Candidatus Gracilibacteria bacterium]|nr:lysine--tRNA ligase [Candidatus Gracilibacteria bacterium]
MSEENKLITERKQKFQEWQRLGFGYASKFDRTHTSAQARVAVRKAKLRDVPDILKKPKNNAALCGRIMNLRDMGKLTFLRIRDNDGDFQICLAKDVLMEGYKTFLSIMDLGDFCGFDGEFFVTKHGEPTLLAATYTPLSKTLRPLPEKFHGLNDQESCYRQRYLDLTTNQETLRRFQIRSQVIQEIRNFFLEKNFQEIETRLLQPQAGGAMAKVFSTHHEALDHDFVLRISLELDLKMAVAGGMERVFEIGKCFRNEGIDPSHLQEFTLLEWYAAYKDMETNMDWTESMIKNILKKVLGTTKLQILDKNNKPVMVDFGKKWHKARFPELLKKYAQLDMFSASRKEIESAAKKWEMEDKDIKKTSTGNLLDHVYKKSARPHLVEPTFVLDYPSELKPLARPHGDGTAECYQLLVAGWEIVNAYGELIDPQIQRKLLENQARAKLAGDAETMDVNEEFLIAMEHGMPPMTGFGLGIDRLVTLITEQTNLRDVVLFPLMRPEK